MTEHAKIQVGVIAHGKRETCVRDLRQAFKVIKGGMQKGQAPEPGEVEVQGNRATVAVPVASRSSQVPLAKEGGRWRLDTFFGTPLGETNRAADRSRTGPFPAATDGPAEVVSPGGSRCPSFFEDSYPEISGGCLFRVTADEVTLSIATPFGDLRFGDCMIDSTSFVDSSGRSWTPIFDVQGKVNNGCSDVHECTGARESKLPWKGRIVSTGEGRAVHRINACFNTCIGYYAGVLSLELERVGQRWKVTAADAQVGESGLRFDGPLQSTPSFDVRTRS
jgi:hypothetical protein